MPHRIDRTRFFSKLKLNTDTGCMEWQGERTPKGYGRLSIYLKPGYTHYAAHRVAAWFAGLIEHPRGRIGGLGKNNVLHTCDNPACCNPDHFFLGSHADNHFDRDSKGRQVRGHAHHLSKLTDDDVATILAAVEKGVSGPIVGKEFGVDSSVIYSTRDKRFNQRSAGVVDVRRLVKLTKASEDVKRDKLGYVRGEKHGRAKLSNNDVKRIRELCACGLFTQAEVAREFKVTPSLVCSILRGRVWVFDTDTPTC